jgi:hypothetical protein
MFGGKVWKEGLKERLERKDWKEGSEGFFGRKVWKKGLEKRFGRKNTKVGLEGRFEKENTKEGLNGRFVRKDKRKVWEEGRKVLFISTLKQFSKTLHYLEEKTRKMKGQEGKD